MAFPTSPTNGQQVTLNYITYQYDSTNTAWYRVSTGVTEPLANLAFGQANTANTLATNAGNFANGAFTLANTSATTLTLAQSYANGAFTQTNVAFSQANSAFAAANTGGLSPFLLMGA